MILMNPAATHKWPRCSRHPRPGCSSIVFTFMGIIFAANLRNYAPPTFAAAALGESNVKISKIAREGVEGHRGGKPHILLLEQLGGEGKDGQRGQNSRVDGGLLKDVTGPYGNPKEDLEDRGWLGEKKVEVDAMEKEESSDGGVRGRFHTSGEMKDELEDNGMKIDKKDGKDRVDSNRSVEANTETGLNSSSLYTIADDMNRLKEVSRHLRGGTGGGSKHTDSAVVFSQVKDITKSYVANMQYIQKRYQDKDNEDNASSIKSTVGDMGTFVEARKEVKEISDEDFHNSFDIFSGDDSFSLDDISDSQLAEFIESKVFDQLVELSQDLAGVLEGIDLSIFTPIGDDSSEETLAQDKLFNFDSDLFDSDPFRKSQFSSYRSSGHSSPHSRDFFSSPAFNNIPRSQKSEMGSRFSSSRLRNFASFLDDDVVSAKHELRLNALGDNICQPECNETDLACNCGNLYSCVDNMTEYDLVVLIAGGYVDTDPTSKSFAHFTVSTKDLHLFDADEGVSEKLERIKTLARGDSVDTTSCTAVLTEFFSACSPSEETCKDANQQAFQVSIDQVCDAVNTPTKLLFEVIGDEFDGFADQFTDAECKPLSYGVCGEFVTEFDRLYDGRDVDSYPLYNPMRKDPNGILYTMADNVAFDRVQFPVGYVFLRDERGVVTREFADPDLSKHHIFSIVNLSNGRALGVFGACSDKPMLELQQHNRGDPRQQYRVGNGGTLINEGCPMKHVTSDSHECLPQIDLVLMDAYDETNTVMYPTQQWRFHSDGSITNIKCPNSAITVIKENSWKSNKAPVPFSIVNPKTNNAMAVADGYCKNGINILVQKSDPDDSSQQFYWVDRKIFSVKCPGKVLDIYKEKCDNGRNIHLWESTNNDNQKWNLTPYKELESVHCRDRVIAIEEGGEAGTNIILWFKEKLDDQKWTLETSHLPILDHLYGPFSIVNSDNSLAISSDSGCESLDVQPLNPGNTHQQFYYGDDIIFSASCEGKVIDNSVTNCGLGESKSSIALHTRNGRNNQQWRIKNKQIKSVNCPGNVISIYGGRGMVPGQDNVGSSIALRKSGSNDWDQKWVERSNNVMISGGSHDSRLTTWRAEFVEPNYDYALLPGFPGVLEDGCYSSRKDTQLAKDAMHSCDKSMSLLIGSQTSVGTLRAIAKLVEENGPTQMPGNCCMDNAANSQHFGYDYNPNSEDYTMNCQNHGPWHLGISSIACENGGGQWFRNPCIVLQDCINARPVNGTEEFSQAFEIFAKELVINDASDESQCGVAREELGFTADHPFDTDVCQQFSEKMCDRDLFFTKIDQITDGLNVSHTWTHIKYESPEYPEDDELTFVELPKRSDFREPLDVGKYTSQLVGLRAAVLMLKSVQFAVSEIHATMKEELSIVCEFAPKSIESIFPAPPCIKIPSPAPWICAAVASSSVEVAFHLLMAANVALKVVTTAYTTFQQPDGEVWDQYHYSKSTFDNFKLFDLWHNDALGIINKNIVTQHHEMRDDLQNRHKQMTDCITCNIINGVNSVGCKMLEFNTGVPCIEADIPDACKNTNCPKDNKALNILLPNVESNLLERLQQIKVKKDHIRDAMQDIQKTLLVGTERVGDERVKSAKDIIGSYISAVETERKDTEVIKDKVDTIEGEMREMKDEMRKMIDQNKMLLEMLA